MQNMGLVIFKWFIPVVCDYNIKYQNDIRWVSQNTTLYYHTILPIPTRPAHNTATLYPY